MNTEKAAVLLGWSAQAIESARKMDKPFVVVSFEDFEPYAKENDIPFVAWDFNQWGDQSNSLILREKLAPFNPNVAIPL